MPPENNTSKKKRRSLSSFFEGKGGENKKKKKKSIEKGKAKGEDKAWKPVKKKIHKRLNRANQERKREACADSLLFAQAGGGRREGSQTKVLG